MSPTSPKQHHYIRTIVRLVVGFGLLAAAAYLLLNRQHVLDQISVWEYHPSAEVTNLVDRAGMNDNGKFLYYASQPKIDGTQSFNQECDRVENSTAILGCYSDNRIYVYNVTDAQLDGIMEVTAAHETLHAAYQRMSDSEKSKIDALLEAEYTKLENDPDYKARMDFYAKSEPGERDNELHSVIGTEVANLSPELEAHYAQYFSNRQDVVALANKYKSVFAALSNQASQLVTQLDALTKSIQADSAQYNIDIKTLNTDIATFNTKASSGGFSSQAQFNSERATLAARVMALDTERTNINTEIDTYNADLTKYNALASQSQKLTNSIDSTLAPVPSIQ